MRQLPILSGFLNYLTAPELPRTSLSISETHLALITLKRSGGEFEPRNLGVLRLPAGLVQPGFTEPNVTDEAALIECLTGTAAQAGMNRLRALSASLPAASARGLVVTLDSVPASRTELAQLIEWKVERSVGQKIGDLRVSYSRLSDHQGRPQYLVSAAHEEVVAQYERIFRQLGWQVGMIAPQHIGEAQWLMRQNLEDDQVVVSLNNRGFGAVVVRGREPVLVREVECEPEERENEFYRLLVFYRDRLLPESGEVTLNRVLTIGSVAEQRRFRDVVSSALERRTVALDPQQIGLRVDPTAPFNHFAAASGLATMAWG
jgi:Tfp pilus assembly PilM family ATPase